MADVKALRISIGKLPTFQKWIRQFVSLFFLIFLPITGGIYAGSSAMQWAGFAFGILAILIYAGALKTEVFSTFDEAIAYLEKERLSQSK